MNDGDRIRALACDDVFFSKYRELMMIKTSGHEYAGLSPSRTIACRLPMTQIRKLANC